MFCVDVFQFPPISRNCTAIEEEWDNIPQATMNSLINSMLVNSITMHEANGAHTIY
jgi:hypothetical protein